MDVMADPPMDLLGIVQNATALEQQQRQWLGQADVATPVPTRSTRALAQHKDENDFSEWAVGERYQVLRMLGRGSYGQVAQAKDILTGKFVAIKRITSAFEQEVDAIRLYREMHILRRLRGHECIIGLLNVVQPPTDDINDFHDLYLVFECKYIGEERRQKKQGETRMVWGHFTWNSPCIISFFLSQ
jgi:serine/threonine protein kinase